MNSSDPNYQNNSTRSATLANYTVYLLLYAAFMQSSPNFHLSAMSFELGAAEPPPLIHFPVRIDNNGLRAKLLRKSIQMGLGIMLTYPEIIDGIPALASYSAGQGFQAAKKLAHQLITLPVHPFISQRDIARIALLISGKN